MRATTWLPFLAGVSWRRMGRAFLAVPLALAAVARAASARDRTIWRPLAAVPVGSSPPWSPRTRSPDSS
jgi:hypothetical protein